MFKTRFWPITANPINPISQLAIDMLPPSRIGGPGALPMPTGDAPGARPGEYRGGLRRDLLFPMPPTDRQDHIAHHDSNVHAEFIILSKVSGFGCKVLAIGQSCTICVNF